MTLITVGNSEGQRSCTARCYDAHGPSCDCVCGGRNHGKGLVLAQEQTAEHARELLVQGVTIQGDLFVDAGA